VKSCMMETNIRPSGYCNTTVRWTGENCGETATPGSLSITKKPLFFLEWVLILNLNPDRDVSIPPFNAHPAAKRRGH
jgi:hypothetical protein